jgi:GT2 family glycosyltransferase
LKFAIVVLTFNQVESTVECLKSILALKPREFPEKNVFVIHNGSDAANVQDLQARFKRFHHVVIRQNMGFTGGANMGLSVAFQMCPWVLFLTQDCTLAHFPQAPPFEPCMAAPKIYKRNIKTMGSIGGAVDFELGRSYFCQKPKDFWQSFENKTLQPFVPRTAFWLHSQVFEKVKGFDENLSSMWEDVDLSMRIRQAEELLQIEENTEIIHHRKGLCRKDPFYRTYLNHRNRLLLSRKYLVGRAARFRFEFGSFFEAFILEPQSVANRWTRECILRPMSMR